jgi:hypothetical protein
LPEILGSGPEAVRAGEGCVEIALAKNVLTSTILIIVAGSIISPSRKAMVEFVEAECRGEVGVDGANERMDQFEQP